MAGPGPWELFSFSISSVKKNILLLEGCRPWGKGKDDKEDCSGPLKFRALFSIPQSYIWYMDGKPKYFVFPSLFLKRQVTFSYSILSNLLQKQSKFT